MRPHPYTHNHRQLRNAENGRKSSPEKSTPIVYPISVSPENMHTSNSIQTE